jgi:hypothetical protein
MPTVQRSGLRAADVAHECVEWPPFCRGAQRSAEQRLKPLDGHAGELIRRNRGIPEHGLPVHPTGGG